MFEIERHMKEIEIDNSINIIDSQSKVDNQK